LAYWLRFGIHMGKTVASAAEASRNHAVPHAIAPFMPSRRARAEDWKVKNPAVTAPSAASTAVAHRSNGPGLALRLMIARALLMNAHSARIHAGVASTAR